MKGLVLIEALLIPLLLLVPAEIAGSSPIETEKADLTKQNQCIEYDSLQKLIEVKCESVHLTNIYNNLSNSRILSVELDNNDSTNAVNGPKIWILNAGIVIDKKASLIIDSTDTSWLKIVSTPTMQLKQKSTDMTDENADYSDDTLTVIQTHANSSASIRNNITEVDNGTIVVSKHNGDNPNGIHVHGSLKIDSVKITSWDPEKNNVVKFDFGKRPGEEHTKSDYDTAEPRAFIRVSKDATGTTNITNSEIAYLGYSCSRCAGISYYGGEGSLIKNSDIHHLLKGYYSKNMGHMLIEGNKFHDNYLYGIDPHTGSNNIIIRNNIVYSNNASGIICSKDCHSLLIEGNEVYNNSGAGRGISFSINTTDSIARNNHVYDNPRCIAFNRESNFNQVYNNTLLNCKTGISVSGTSNNLIRDNKIVNATNGISIKNITNQIYNNEISSSKNGIVFLSELYSNMTDNSIDVSLQDDHNPLNNSLTEMINKNLISDTKNPLLMKTANDNDTDIEDTKNSTSDVF
ncbi:MAG TPA: right-handed parallel beta-helix repeat-containing protein [Nitrososphaeraceae archaeon]|nr:right-handed parallel beta-helix repeat-containing protein [Nitrososphaeraceae archaeon]